MSRITRDKIELRMQKVDLGKIARDAVEGVAMQCRNRRIDLNVAVSDPPPRVHGDPARLQQIKVNLLNNAIKYSPEGSAIDMTVGAENGEAVIRVRDRGAGMPPEVRNHVFELFFQKDPGGRQSDGGMGVGLTLVKSLVELHGGKVEAHSDGPGKGSEFVVRLPLLSSAEECVPESPAAPRRAALPAKSPPFKTVIVEDQPANRTMLKALLESRGYEVHAAADGRSGIDLIRRERPDVALVDIGLPDIEGYEVARALRNGDATDTFLIALTGYGQPSDVARALEVGFDRHLVKPLDLDAFESLFSECCD